MRSILLIAMFVASLPVKEVTLRIPLQPGKPEEIAVLTFDADRVSAQDLKKWMLLHESAYYDTPMFGYYPECKPSDIPKLEGDIKKTEHIVNDLDPSNYPGELTDVVRYLRDLQSFWLWLGQQELAFIKGGKMPETEYKGIGICQARNFMDKRKLCNDLFHYWHSCAVDLVGKKLGSYPKEKWKAFLDSFGIQERIESTLD